MRFLIFRFVVITGLMSMAASVLVAQESKAQPRTLAGQINGQVRSTDGQPVFNALVTCESRNSGNCGQDTSDRSGKFRFTGLEPSQYIITIRTPGFMEQKQEVELLSSPSAFVQFQLRPDGSPRPVTSPSSLVVDANVPAAAKHEFDQAATVIAAGKKDSLNESVRHLEKAITLYPQFVEANLLLGTTYMDLGQMDKAEQSLKRTVELNPKAANALFALGELYLKQKKDQDAEKVLLQGLQIEDRSPQGHLTLARVYWSIASQIKDEAQARPSLEKAYEQVKKALELNPNMAQAHVVKGNLLLRVRRAADAQHEFEEYLRLEPKGPFAEQARTTAEKIKKALESQPKQP